MEIKTEHTPKWEMDIDTTRRFSTGMIYYTLQDCEEHEAMAKESIFLV